MWRPRIAAVAARTSGLRLVILDALPAA